MTGNGAAHQQQPAFDIDANDVEVLDRALHVAHVTRHFFAREDSTRILRLANGARHAMRARVTVRIALAPEMVTLDGTGEALTDSDAGDVDLLARCKNALYGDNGTRCELGGALG